MKRICLQFASHRPHMAAAAEVNRLIADFTGTA
jgi:hypothetical protein